jgi:hypothetical protein
LSGACISTTVVAIVGVGPLRVTNLLVEEEPTVARNLKKVYCAEVRRCGSNGIWEPDSWLAPGDYGYFRSGGLLEREGALSELGYTYDTATNAPSMRNLQTASISAKEGTADAAVADPIEYVLSAKTQVSYQAGGAAEVLVLMGLGRWWTLENRSDLLSEIKANIEKWPVGRVVVADVYATYGGVVGVSSQSASGFTLGLGAKGAPHLVVRVGATGLIRRLRARAASQTFALWQGDGDREHGDEVTARPERGRVYTPLFGDTYRVSAHWFGHFGRKELLTEDGRPAAEVIARTPPANQVYKASQATISLDEIRALGVDELFERVTPQTLDQDVDSEGSSRPQPAGLEPA